MRRKVLPINKTLKTFQFVFPVYFRTSIHMKGFNIIFTFIILILKIYYSEIY